MRAAERRTQAVELRKAGMAYSKIGNQLGISSQAAHKHVTSALREIGEKTAEDAVELMRLELERLDQLQLEATKQLRAGNTLQAIDRVLKVMARRAKLLGLDAPDHVTVSEQEVRRYKFDLGSLAGKGPDELTPEEIDAAMAALLNKEARFL